MKIFKYYIETTDETTISLPKGARILTAQVHPVSNGIYIWALVDPDEEEIEDRTIQIYGTGHSIPEHYYPDQLIYINTVQLHLGQLVFHIFEYKDHP